MIENILNNLKLNCINRKVPIFTDKTKDLINKLLVKYKPTNCLEIWSAVWYSSITIANIINQWWWTITWFEISFPSYKEWLSNIQSSGLHNINMYNFDFTKTPISKYIKNKVDFVFIDWMKRDYLIYYNIIRPFLKKWCIIIFDDVIKFEDRMKNLYGFFQKNQIFYQQFKIDADDWVILIIHK